MAAFVAVVRHARTPGARLTHGRGFESRRGRRVAPLRTAVQESVQSTAMSNDVNEPELRARLTDIGLELRECLDKGSYAAVFRAVSTGADPMNTSTDWLGEPGKTFAVKILLKSMLNEDSARDFRRESLLLSRVDHPGIIKMYHVGRSPQPFMVMEYCCGGNLWNAIQCDRLKASTLLDVAGALAYLHGAGFAHRDIKSSNVLLTWCEDREKVVAKLCDFGSAAPVNKLPRRPAKPQWGGLEKLIGFSGRWQPVGTMLWMAPEMLEPPVEGTEAPVGYSGEKVDVYSLAVVLWEMMEWRVPWTGSDVSKAEVVEAVVRRQERLPIPDRCSPQLAGLVSRMWVHSPGERPASDEVAAVLKRMAGSWDDAGHVERVAREANARGQALTALLAASTVERAQENLKAEDAVEAAVSEYTAPVDANGAVNEMEVASSAGGEQSAAKIEGEGEKKSALSTEIAVALGVKTSSQSNEAAAADLGPRVLPSEDWFGDVGTVGLADFNERLAPALYPHVRAAVVPETDAERVAAERAEFAELTASWEDMKARSKVDPFAAFSADAKGREVKRLKKKILLEEAEGEVNAWKTVRDVLREQLVAAETQHLEWKRRVSEIERGKF